MPASDQIVVSGAREHNLKDISLTLPRDALVVITGLSGSGKSSLAFDTIYAEGQRRYVESLSAYARQFLGQMDKPDVDSIEGLSPAISIDQKTTSRNPRSTVGHGDGDLRLPAAVVVAGGQATLPHLRAPDRGAVGGADHRSGDGAGGGDALHGDGAARARAQGGVRQAAGGAAHGRVPAGEDRRSRADAGGIDRAGQALQARHLGRGRSPGDAPRPAQALGGLDRDGGGARGRARGDRDRRRFRQGRIAEEEVARARPARRACARRPRRSSRARCRRRGRCSRSPSASPAPSTARRWSSWSRGSSRSTRPTGRASAARGWARRWRSTRSCSCPTRRCRWARARSCRGRTACRTTTSRSPRRSPSATTSIWTRPGKTSHRRIATCSCTGPMARSCRSPTATATGAGALMRRASRGS